MLREENIHGECVVLGEQGVLIRGPSGSGKTTLALMLIERWREGGAFARLVADDRLLMRVSSGRILVRAPETIAGLAEAYGLGPACMAFEGRAVVDLVVDLVAQDAAPRFGEGQTCLLAGCELPLLVLAQKNADGAVAAISAQLRRQPFLQASHAAAQNCVNMAVPGAYLGLSTKVSSTR
jgi:serine kinase of HPr protein (carbohydrate metabolism regulator)